MAWVSIDDQFHDHPKAEQVGPLGRDLYVAGLEYANRNLTDGFIPKATAGRLVSFYDIPGIGVTVNPYDIVNLLLDAGLWIAVEGGFEIHDYLDYQPSAEEVTRRREQKRERQQRWREKQSAEEEASTDENEDVSVDVSVDASRDGLQDGQTQDPRPKTQVIPKRPKEQTATPAAPRSKLRVVDEIFDAVIAVCYGKPPDQLTRDERGRANRAVKQLRELGATAEQIYAREKAYRSRSPGFPLTPQTLTKSWTALGDAVTTPNGLDRYEDWTGRYAEN